MSLSDLGVEHTSKSHGDCLEVKREYYQNSSVLDCVTQCSQSAAHLCESFLQVQQIGFVTLGPLTLCVEAVAIIVTWWSGSLRFKPDLDDQLVSFSALTLLV